MSLKEPKPWTEQSLKPQGRWGQDEVSIIRDFHTLLDFRFQSCKAALHSIPRHRSRSRFRWRKVGGHLPFELVTPQPRASIGFIHFWTVAIQITNNQHEKQGRLHANHRDLGPSVSLCWA